MVLKHRLYGSAAHGNIRYVWIGTLSFIQAVF